jgi:hypothetical protein
MLPLLLGCSGYSCFLPVAAVYLRVFSMNFPFYAVKRGRNTGVFESLQDVKQQVEGLPPFKVSYRGQFKKIALLKLRCPYKYADCSKQAFTTVVMLNSGCLPRAAPPQLVAVAALQPLPQPFLIPEVSSPYLMVLYASPCLQRPRRSPCSAA